MPSHNAFNAYSENLDLSCLHDAQFVGIKAIDEVVDLDFILVNKTLNRLRLQGVSRMRADGFREGNIVLDARVIDSSALTRELVAELLGNDDDDCVAKVLANAQRNRFLAVAVSPSYGCSLLAFCSRVYQAQKSEDHAI